MAARRRISRTPYIVTASEIDEVLKHCPPRLELAVAAQMNVTVDVWRSQPDKIRVRQIIELQNAGALAASLAAAERAIGDLEAAVLPTSHPTDDLIDQLIDGLHRRGLLVVNPSTAQKGA